MANELCLSRAYVLAWRCRGEALAVLRHRAQSFPGPAIYDRVICDVPCSGDGTMRPPARWGRTMR